MKSRRVLPILLILFALLLFSACNPSGDSKTPTDVTLTAIRIDRAPDKTAYIAGESFDPAGMKVVAVYSDGGESTVTAYTCAPTLLSAEDTAVTVSYRGLTAVQPISVSAPEVILTEIRIDSAPYKTVYTVGESFDPAGMTVVAVYSDGSERIVTDYTFAPILLSEEDTAVTVSYGGLTAVLTIDVFAAESATLSIDRLPIRTLYFRGESFDPTGIRLLLGSDGEETAYTSCEYEASALTAGQTAVTVRVGSYEVDVPIDVVDEPAISFSSQSVEAEYRAEIDDFVDRNGAVRGIDLGFFSPDFSPEVLLPDPYPDGVSDFAELVEAADRFLFYGVTSFVVRADFEYGELEDLLDRLYFESDFIAGIYSLTGQASGEYIRFVLKEYAGDMISAKNNTAPSCAPDFSRTPVTRDESYRFASIAEDGISVYNSEQAIYALAQGYAIAPVPGSPAEAVVEKAKQVLRSCCDDAMGDFEKLYAVYRYLICNVVYDMEGEVWAGSVPEACRRYESEMYTARLVSFRAEGPLLYGNAACYGYAKAAALLLGIEGLDLMRVVGKYKAIVGRSILEYNDAAGGYSSEIGVHSYLYVHIDGYDYLFDATYAYSGSPYQRDGKNYTMYRDLSVALSKNEHARVYRDMADDKFSGSPDYRPGAYSLYADLTYDGTHDLLLSSTGEVRDYLNAIKEQFEGENKIVSFSVMVKSSVYGDDLASFRSDVMSAVSAILGSDRYYYYTTNYVAEENGYFAIYFVKEIA